MSKIFTPRISNLVSDTLTLSVSGCMFFFGLVCCLQGLVKNYHGLLATRFFLGVFEAGMCL